MEADHLCVDEALVHFGEDQIGLHGQRPADKTQGAAVQILVDTTGWGDYVDGVRHAAHGLSRTTCSKRGRTQNRCPVLNNLY